MTGHLEAPVDQEVLQRFGISPRDYATAARGMPQLSEDRFRQGALLFEMAGRTIVRFSFTVTGLAHEIKAAINAIMGRSSFLSDTYGKAGLTEGLVRERFSDISSQCGLIDLLLENAVALGVHPSSYHFHWTEVFKEVIIPVLSMHKTAAQGKGIKLEYEGHLRVPPVYADRRRLQLVFHNLVLNAVKYSRRGTTVRVVGYPGREVQRFSILNQGIGVPAAEEEFIFAMGRRGSNAIEFHPQGQGFGLALSREIVERHGGALELSRRRDPTIFTVALPTRPGGS